MTHHFLGVHPSGNRCIRTRRSGPEVLRLAAASAREFQGEVKGFRGF